MELCASRRQGFPVISMLRTLLAKSPNPQGSETLRSLRRKFGSGCAVEPSRSARKPRPNLRLSAVPGPGETGCERGYWSSGGNRNPTFSARRETGGWMRMKESYVEGVAAHDGPESCADAREGGGVQANDFIASGARAASARRTGMSGERVAAAKNAMSCVTVSGRRRVAHRYGPPCLLKAPEGLPSTIHMDGRGMVIRW